MRFRRSIFACGLAAVLLASCSGGNSAPTLPSGSIALKPAAKNGALLYVSDLQSNTVLVYSYPQGKHLGTLTNFGTPRSLCSDAVGNVWIADTEGEDVVEYAHGGTTPLAGLNINGPPTGCSVDPVTGNLAVSGGEGGIVLSIFRKTKHGWGSPRRLLDQSMDTPGFCAYDDKGNLFLDGRDKANGNAFLFYELRHGARSFVHLKLDQTIKMPGQVQWDGSSIAVADAGVSPTPVYRFAISKANGRLTGTTRLRGSRTVRQFWIDGGTLIGPNPAGHDLGFWTYPDGGSPLNTISNLNAYGATVSAGQ
ncbi:MAG TPA: hypothetical protein VJP76_05210 [Candidatus Tumulicola sp.]|nr:hypothetical protein [Candidatus Tumulicola sp.]